MPQKVFNMLVVGVAKADIDAMSGGYGNWGERKYGVREA